MHAADVMTPDVICAAPETPVPELIRLMVGRLAPDLIERDGDKEPPKVATSPQAQTSIASTHEKTAIGRHNDVFRVNSACHSRR